MRLKIKLLVLLLVAAPVQAREYSDEYKQILRDAAQRRHQEVVRHNYAQQQAVQMVTQGLQMLARPSDPWNVPRRSYQPYRAPYGTPNRYIPRYPRY